MRASEMRTMSRTPASSSFLGIGSMPHSGMPGAPTGPLSCSTSTLSGVTASSGSSMRASRSLKLLNTTAGPVCCSSLGSAAARLSTAPRGARYVLAQRAAVHRQARQVELRLDPLEQREQAAGVVEILHQEGAAGLQV